MVAQLLRRPGRMSRESVEQRVEIGHRRRRRSGDRHALPARLDLFQRHTRLALQLQHGSLQNDRPELSGLPERHVPQLRRGPDADRLQALLNTNVWTFETFGVDGTRARRLATTRLDGVDVGATLMGEGLARGWSDGEEFWYS